MLQSADCWVALHPAPHPRPPACRRAGRTSNPILPASLRLSVCGPASATRSGRAPARPRRRAPRAWRGDLARHRRHPTIGARIEPLLGHVLERLADHSDDLVRRLDLVGRHVDHAQQHVLPAQELEQADRDMRVDALDRHLVEAARRQRRENFLVLPPFRAQRVLPVDIGLDAIAVADVHCSAAFEPFDGAVQRIDAPALHVVHVDVEGRLVELDHVHALGFQRQRLLVEQLGEGHRQLDFVTVVRVGDGVDDGHGAGHGDLESATRVGPRHARLGLVNAPAQPQLPDHHRHHRVVAVVADAHLDLVLEVDALDRLEKAVDEVLPRLLAVAHHVDPGVFLRLDPEQSRIALALGQVVSGELPLRPQLVGLGEPGRLRQAAGDGGFEHVGGVPGRVTKGAAAPSRDAVSGHPRNTLRLGPSAP